MSLNSTIANSLRRRGINKPFNESMRDFFLQEEDNIDTYLLGSSVPMENRISLFCPSLITNSSGLLSVFITDTGSSSGSPLFQDLEQCSILLTPFTINAGTSNNSVPILSIQSFNNETGELRIVAKKARGTLVLSSSAFIEGNGIKFNLTISGEAR